MSKIIIAVVSIWTLFLVFSVSNQNVVFIGDQAWFYISARDFIVNGDIPLVGITSSHTWIHQGPFWTYLLVVPLSISGFNPLSGVFLAIIFGAISIFLAYKIGSDFFSEKLGLIFAVLFAVSPLAVYHFRFAYHTTPVPLFVLLLFYSTIKWIKGNNKYFPIVILSMSILYNFHLATTVFWSIIILYLLLGFYKRKKFAVNLLNKKIIFLSIVALFVPMIPVLIYDIQNDFSQTIKFGGWYGYNVLQLTGLSDKGSIGSASTLEAFNFFVLKYEQLTFILNKYLSLLIFIVSFIVPVYYSLKEKFFSALGIIFSFTTIGVAAYFMSGVPSEAYIVMLFPGLLFLLAYSIYKIKYGLVSFIIIATISIVNIFYLFTTNFLTEGRVTLDAKIDAVGEILRSSESKKINLKYKGVGEEFESSSMPYEYLIWWKDGRLSKNGDRVLINEKEDRIIVEIAN